LYLSYRQLSNELDDTELLKQDGHSIFLKLFGKILEFDIDIIEKITAEIQKLSKVISNPDKMNEKLIYEITRLQEKLIVIRRNIIDKQRILLSVTKHESFLTKKNQKTLMVLEKDVHSILDYISFDFERLEYLQDTLMGLINLRQNVIMKIFTIVSVIFLPPTLIASIYGMNFQNMPELNFPYAYPIALSVMIGLSLLALRYFKKKSWI
jgi:magnesium transporter